MDLFPIRFAHDIKLEEQSICIRVRWPFRGPVWAEEIGQKELYAMPCTEEAKSPSESSFHTSNLRITAVNWGEFSKSRSTWSETEAVVLWGEPE